MAFARWRRPCPFEEGYTIFLPSPMDMPFLLRYSLEGLAKIDTSRCKQILVIPDGWGNDGGRALREVVDASDDPRVEMVELHRTDRLWLRAIGPTNGADIHWLLVVNGTTFARHEYAFLHDSDAFFLEADGLERQYQTCLDRGLEVLGVTARWDEFFQRIGYQIPGTWELMYSTRWARRRSPFDLKGGRRPTPEGEQVFDSMLHAMYLDYPSGKVGVMDPPPRFVHFSGTIVTYRAFRDRRGATVRDELFRVLLLALLEELIPAPDGRRVVPTVEELARGLSDPTAPVRYDSEVAVEQFPVFRGMLDELCDSPVFQGSRGDRIRSLVRPFDEHFAPLCSTAVPPETKGPKVRTHGLG
jgi:hypothetical protein